MAKRAMAKKVSVKDLRKQVALSCRILGARGVTKGSFGHVSVRIPGTDRILIKAKGPDEEALEFARERDIITIDLDGKVLEAPKGLDSPNETAMHLAVYRKRPEVQSVIHTHPDWVVALTACDKPLLPIYAAYNPPGLRLLIEGIPVYQRSVTIVDDELGEDFMRAMGDKKVCLLTGHGMTTAGSSVEEATLISLNVFELARMNYLAYAIGDPKPIPQQDLEEYKQRWARGQRARLQGPSSTGEHADWRYNVKLLKKSA
ncbi:MAG TPA: class II aldolase/adducin family protein [Candidatus Acidoferrales bacterium]|nr:class II aldolase/adducin family protein [Candidatus Acidoferrales bacterium]